MERWGLDWARGEVGGEMERNGKERLREPKLSEPEKNQNPWFWCIG